MNAVLVVDKEYKATSWSSINLISGATRHALGYPNPRPVTEDLRIIPALYPSLMKLIQQVSLSVEAKSISILGIFAHML